MAKGDKSRSQNQQDYQGGFAQNNLNNTNNAVDNTQVGLAGNYKNAVATDTADYSNIMQGYKNTAAGITGQYAPMIAAAQGMATGGGGVSLDNSNVDAAISGFKDYSQTGGFSGDDLSNIRARAVSPTRSIYSSAQDNLARQNELTGGYSPNAVAGQAKLARDQSQQISEADTTANANIAQMVQQGKLYGLTGLSNAALQQQANAIQAGSVNNQARLGGLNAWGSGLSGEIGAENATSGGMAGLYSATPGMMATTGNQMLTGQGQQLQGSGLQNQLSLGLIGAQNQNAQIPGDFQSAMGNIGSGLGLVGDIAGALGTGGTPKSTTTG